MLNKDLEKKKKKYGENMMKLCRELFPSILEEKGVLSKIILSNFYPNHNLYDDIIDNKLENNFKNYIYNGDKQSSHIKFMIYCNKMCNYARKTSKIRKLVKK